MAALIVAAALVVAHRLGAGLVPTLLIGLNLATFVLYGYDKAVAGRGWVRVPERVLHGLALVGGSPAALFSQRFFRHKTSKPEFQKVFVATLLLQLAAVVGVVLVAR